jgi:hypothetical protein
MRFAKGIPSGLSVAFFSLKESGDEQAAKSMLE